MKIFTPLIWSALALAQNQCPSVMLFSPVGEPLGPQPITENNSTANLLMPRACTSGYGRCDTGYCCPITSECCVDGCGPQGSQCCNGGGYCDAGNDCYILDSGRRTCCTDSSCTAYVDTDGSTVQITQTFTYDVTITYYTYYYYDATILESDFDYYYTTYYIYATDTYDASSSAAGISQSIEASLSAEYTPPPLPTLAPSTESEPDFEPSHTYTPEIITRPPLASLTGIYDFSSSALASQLSRGSNSESESDLEPPSATQPDRDPGTTTQRVTVVRVSTAPAIPGFPGATDTAGAMAASFRGGSEGLISMVLTVASLSVGLVMLVL